MGWFVCGLFLVSTCVFVLSLVVLRVCRAVDELGTAVQRMAGDVRSVASLERDGWKWAVNAANSIAADRWRIVSRLICDLHEVFVGRAAYVVRRDDASSAWVCMQGEAKSRPRESALQALAELRAVEIGDEQAGGVAKRFADEAFGASANVTVESSAEDEREGADNAQA